MLQSKNGSVLNFDKYKQERNRKCFVREINFKSCIGEYDEIPVYSNEVKQQMNIFTLGILFYFQRSKN